MTTATVVSSKPVDLRPLFQEDVLSNVFSFLDPSGVAVSQRVCRTWNGLISASDQIVWKEQCGIHKPSVILPGVRDFLGLYLSNQVTGVFTSALLELITAYSGDANYKEYVSVIRGKVQLNLLIPYIRNHGKIGSSGSEFRWGNDQREPFATVQAFSEESINRCQTEHCQNLNGEEKNCKNLGWQGTWFDVPPRGLSNFPTEFPLRLFFCKDGSYKKEGDTLQIIHQGRKVILVCHYDKELLQNRRFSSFAACMAKRVEESMERNYYTTQADVNQAKVAAAIAGEWISSD